MKHERKFRAKKIRKGIFNLKKLVTLLITAFTLISCGTLQISPQYRSMVQQPSPGERIIARVAVAGEYRNCTGEHSSLRLGGDVMQLPGALAFDRHPHESAIDKLLDEARRRFPDEQVSIRNATRRARHILVPQPGLVQGQACQYYFFADVVVTSPMPQPVTHSEVITVTEGAMGDIIASDGSILGQVSFAHVTRADLYRRAHNWLTDGNHTGRVEIRNAQFELGRISGLYSFSITTIDRRVYIIHSQFTVDVHDARAQIRFDNTVLRRNALIYNAEPVVVIERVSPIFRDEPIFLQSLADIAHMELIYFSNALISQITSPD